MADVKDILGVPRTGGGQGEATEKSEKPDKPVKLVKPKGMSREAFALLSSSHPLAPSQLMGELKKGEGSKDRPRKRGQITFCWRSFTPPGREDGLELNHWVKCYKDAITGAITPADKEYPFAKYNKPTKILKYDNEEWAALIAEDPNWTREESDYLLDLVQRMDMRWVAIADRYNFSQAGQGHAGQGQMRTVEDIKARYYSIARQLLIGREGGPDAVANHSLIKHPFNAQHEKERKRGLELLMTRTPEQEADEDSILAEAAKIEAKRKSEAGVHGSRRGGVGGGNLGGPSAPSGIPLPLIEVADIEEEPEVGTPPLFDADGKPALPTLSPDAPADSQFRSTVLARTTHTKEVIDTIIRNTQPEKLQKMLQGSMAELKLPVLPRTGTRRVCAAYLALMREVLEHLELKRQLATKQALIGAKRAAVEELSNPMSEKRPRVAKKAFE